MSVDNTITRESSYANQWSEQHQIYYYSKFDLFNHDSEEEFYQFSIFGEKVSAQLGSDWISQANLLYYPYISSKQVFLNLLELWLKHHPTVNSMRSTIQKSTIFSVEFVNQFDRLVQQQLRAINPSLRLKPVASSLKAVCLGFYMTANEIWQQLFRQQNARKRDIWNGNTFWRGMAGSIEKTFKPLMVVTQKISNVFGHKKRKLNEQSTMQDYSQLKFQNCYHEFKRTMDIQKQLERKMSDFNLEDYEPVSTNKTVQKKTFMQQESPMKSNIISSVYSYLTDFIHRNPSWQIASNFVTQILDLNQVSLDEGKKVKVMRPAQDFYKKLVMAWLVCQQGTQMFSFQEYLNILKTSFFSQSWESRFIIPTKYFFEKMKANWQEIKKQNREEDLNEKAILSSFINGIKGSMKEDWNHKIQARLN